ncbi:MAG: DUF7405 family protein [Gaiellaceae bacterium]
MRFTRKQVVVGAAAAGVLGAAGIYEAVDQLTTAPDRPAAAAAPGPEQHLLGGQRIIRENGAEVIVPPLHHEIVTATVETDDLRDAQRRLEEALAGLDRRYPATPAGLGVLVAWGLPYFRRYVPAPAQKYLPRDRRAEKPALLDAVRFPSDPADTILEQNDVAVLLRSDKLDHIADAEHALFDGTGLFRVTSIRKGFAGGGFDGGVSLPKQMAVTAGVGGADLIPDSAELFMGFTSTLVANLGPAHIANLETLGLAIVPEGYFRGGTHMHLSHIAEDLEAWYLNFAFDERVDTMFRPHLKVKPGTQTVPQGPGDVATSADVVRDYEDSGTIGHSQAIQPSSRLQEDYLGEDGTLYKKGTAIPQRADFNTLDNPFFWSADPKRDRMKTTPTAGVHFVVFNPTSDDFHRNRMAMDGVLPDGTKLKFEPHSRGQGFNAVLTTTHRQNFLVPPRRYRSFPLVERL